MSFRVRLNIVTLKGTGQGVQILNVAGEFMQRNCMAAAHLRLFSPFYISSNYSVIPIHDLNMIYHFSNGSVVYV